jgi:hypothetical protein
VIHAFSAENRSLFGREAQGIPVNPQKTRDCRL